MVVEQTRPRMKEKNQTVSIIGDKLKLDVSEKRHRGGSLCKGRNSRKIRREESVRSVSRKDTEQRHTKNQSGLYPGTTQHKDTPRTSQVCIQKRHTKKTRKEESVSFVFMGVRDCYPRTHVLCLLAALIINSILTYTNFLSDIAPPPLPPYRHKHTCAQECACKHTHTHTHTHTFS